MQLHGHHPTHQKENELITYSGFRVETLVDPLSDDKSFSYQYKYVPLKNIKPFASYEQFLWPQTREQFHPSIEYAMTTMASWSLLHYTKFKGEWPNAKIYCKGIWIGHELLAIKDAVRLKPLGLTAEILDDKSNTTKDEKVTDVMVIEQIWLSLEGCISDPKNPQYAKSYQPYVAGQVYTVDPNRLNRPIGFDKDELQQLTDNEVDTAFQCVGMQGYGPWYRLSGGRTCAVSKNMLLGRCYEPEAAYLHFGTFKDLGYDLHGMLNGRAFSAKADERMPEGANWFWGDYRAETLGLATMNGEEVGPAAEQRENMPRWQAMLRILNDCMKPSDLRIAFKDPKEYDEIRGPGRPPKEHFAASKLVSAGFAGSALKDETSVDEDTEGSNEGPSGNVSEMDLPKQQLTVSIPFREKDDAEIDDSE
jgi:Transcription-silencing protein Clr2.